MGGAVNVVCCQLAPAVTDPGRSAAQAGAALRAALSGGAELVLVPELASSGYVFSSDAEVRAAAVRADGELVGRWAALAREFEAVVVAGFCELGDDDRVYNSALLADGSGVRAIYRKLHLWGDEARWFQPGSAAAPVIETAIGRIGLGICYDIEFPELTRSLALCGADLLAFPTNWPADQQPPMLAMLASTTAYLSRVFVAVCDRAGAERGVRFAGASTIAAPDGAVLAGAESGGTVQTVAARCELALAREKHNGPLNHVFDDRRAGIDRIG